MQAIMSWILSILGIVVIGAIVDIFLNEKKLGKTVKSVLSSLVVLIIITPLPFIFNNQNGCSGFLNSGEIELNQSFLDYANSQKVSALEKGVESELNQKGYKNVKIKIDAQISTSINITQVKIIITDVVIDNPALNINKVERIANLCAELLGIDKSIIMIIE